jgi:hypothetical protein
VYVGRPQAIDDRAIGARPSGRAEPWAGVAREPAVRHVYERAFRSQHDEGKMK